jgi:hypothetical protein
MAPAFQAAGLFTHGGALVDASNGDAIRDGMANAYASEGTDSGVCPQGQGPIDARPSDAQGNFTLRIGRDHPSYLAIYCANGFQARPVPGNDNTRDGSRVSPDPVRLYPTRARLSTLKLDPVFVAYSAISRTLDGATSDLKYFRGADAGGFAAAEALLDPTTRQALQALVERPATGRARPVADAQPNAARQAIAIVLATASDDLRYFDAVPQGNVLQLGLPKLSDADRRIVALLMMRPARSVPPV